MSCPTTYTWSQLDSSPARECRPLIHPICSHTEYRNFRELVSHDGHPEKSIKPSPAKPMEVQLNQRRTSSTIWSIWIPDPSSGLLLTCFKINYKQNDANVTQLCFGIIRTLFSCIRLQALWWLWGQSGKDFPSHTSHKPRLVCNSNPQSKSRLMHSTTQV